VDRSLRRRGELLVVVGALLGAFSGVALGLVMDDTQSHRAVATPGRTRGAALAVSPRSSQPAASRAASSEDRADGSDSAGRQRDESADRADKRHGKARKDGEGGRNKPAGRGKDKTGKGKDR
jgi:hypothetical protein